MTSVLSLESDGAGTPRRRGRGLAVAPGASTCGDGDGERDMSAAVVDGCWRPGPFRWGRDLERG